jgi:UDP-glucose 4-epimerase
MKVLLTGGTGYIGSHIAVELLSAGHDLVILDNLHNSSEEALRRVETITGKAIVYYNNDIRDQKALDTVFREHGIDAVIHCAGLKAIAESVENPLLYYDVNVGGATALLKTMQKFKVNKFVFSSSATVYGSAPYPYEETMQTGIGIANPYGHTKCQVEEIMQDTVASDASLQFVSLRYFNPVGAHESGFIGEDPNGAPNNLMPYIAQVAAGKRDKVRIWGNDYDTVDGTGVRDYIHVVDLAKGHLAALERLKPGFDAINLGSGTGTSVLQVIHAFEKACGHEIAYEVLDRRPGDLPEYYANAEKAKKLLGWQTEKTIDDICSDTWRWQSKNPDGYR